MKVDSLTRFLSRLLLNSATRDNHVSERGQLAQAAVAPLARVKVLDFTHVLAGPFVADCWRILALTSCEWKVLNIPIVGERV